MKSIVLISVLSIFCALAKDRAPVTAGCLAMVFLLMHEGQILVTVAKGIEAATLSTMSEVIEDELAKHGAPHVEVAALSGPTHAEEVSRDLPSAIVAACRSGIPDDSFSPLLQPAANDQHGPRCPYLRRVLLASTRKAESSCLLFGCSCSGQYCNGFRNAG